MGGASFGPTAVAAFILFLGILIFVHELGHFMAAKYFNIKVLKFSLGFGPPLFRYTKGETTYQVALLPLGGYVKMLGDAPGDEVEPEDQDRSFMTVPVYQRAIVAFAGPLMNLVFPIVCLFGYFVLGPTVISPVVGHVEVETAAERGGLLPGDRVVSIDGQRVWDFDQMAALVRSRPGQRLRFEVEREPTPGAAKVVVPLEITPDTVDGTDFFGDPVPQGRIGVVPARMGTRVGVDAAVGEQLGFVTGDRVLSFAGARPTKMADLDHAVAAHAGQTVDVVLARPEALGAGDLLLAKREVPVTLRVAVPAGARTSADLGLAAADVFVRFVEPDGPAARAGLRSGDRVVAIDGRRVAMFYSFATALERAELTPVKVTVSRRGERHELTIVNDKKTITHATTLKERPYYDAGLGLGPPPRMTNTLAWPTGGPVLTEVASVSLWEAGKTGVERTVELVGGVMMGVAKLFTGGVSLKTIGGPVMLFQVAAEAVELGLGQYLQLLALISVNLGIMNLLPIPVLDGGHLVFCAIEAIKRRPVSLRVRELATIVGLVLLLVLIVVAFTNDVTRVAS